MDKDSIAKARTGILLFLSECTGGTNVWMHVSYQLARKTWTGPDGKTFPNAYLSDTETAAAAREQLLAEGKISLRLRRYCITDAGRKHLEEIAKEHGAIIGGAPRADTTYAGAVRRSAFGHSDSRQP